MPRHHQSFAQTLLKSPWYVSAAIGVLVFIAMRWALPMAMSQNQASHQFAPELVRMSPMALILFGLFAFASALFDLKRRRLVDQQTSLESLRKTSWKDFEFLVSEAFRRQGYQVEYSLGRGADGGIDLVLRRDGGTALVQCKQWKVNAVGVSVVREMYGLMTAEKADEAIVITTGNFTGGAGKFADGKPIRLIDGSQLLALVKAVQVKDGQSVEAEKLVPNCPNCGNPMVLRTTRRGGNTGNQFWGCSRYPGCKGTREL